MAILYTTAKAVEDPRHKDTITVSYKPATDRVNWVHEPWEQAVVDTNFLYGDCGGDQWFDCLGATCSGAPLPAMRPFATIVYSPKYTSGAVRVISPTELITAIQQQCAETDFWVVFLDSFSVIENGERARYDSRLIPTSPGQKALIEYFMAHPSAVAFRSPREVEVLVANVLTAIGFTNVTLRRYIKDNGVDILAFLARSGVPDETVVVEVKHGKRGIGLAVLDRLNGVRSRLNADRALAVTSAYVTTGARTAYQGHDSYMSARTLEELFAVLRDSDDWTKTPHGLWSKRITGQS
jgi:hypothetical protein